MCTTTGDSYRMTLCTSNQEEVNAFCFSKMTSWWWYSEEIPRFGNRCCELMGMNYFSVGRVPGWSEHMELELSVE